MNSTHVISRFLNKKLFPYLVDSFIGSTSNNDNAVTKQVIQCNKYDFLIPIHIFNIQK